jgi:ribosomal protein L11 methyltransferase
VPGSIKVDQRESDRPREWLELRVEASLEAVEAVSEVLARHGHQGGVVIQEAHKPAADRVSLKRDPTRPAVLLAYLLPAQMDKLRRIEVALELLGNLSPISPLQVRVVREEDWADAWKRHYSLLRVGENIVIVPSWQDFQPAGAEIVIHLDPGMAFGTGLHPTTQLCLRALERHLQEGDEVLDLGTGSGILAIAVAKLGSGSVLALDKDPSAVRAAQENCRRNGVTSKVVVKQGSLPAPESPFDLVLANLLAGTLQEMAALLAESLSSGGTLIASGVLHDQAEEVTGTLMAEGFRLIEQLPEEDWVGLVLRR